MDPHTGTAYAVAQQYKRMHSAHGPVVILSTASPYKFPDTVIDAIQGGTEKDDEKAMLMLYSMTGIPVPENLRDLFRRPICHGDIIDPEEMLEYVLKKTAMKEWKP